MKILSLKIVMILFIWAMAGGPCFGNEEEHSVNEHYSHQNPYEEEDRIPLVNPHVQKEGQWIGGTGYTYTLPATLHVPGKYEPMIEASASRNVGWELVFPLHFYGGLLGGSGVALSYLASGVLTLGTIATGGVAGVTLAEYVRNKMNAPWVEIEREEADRKSVRLKRRHKKFIVDALQRGPRRLSFPNVLNVLAFPKHLNIFLNKKWVSQRIVGTFEILEGRHRGDVLELDYADTKRVNGCLKTLKDFVGLN